MKSFSVADYPVFALGFRAFFASAGLAALALMVLWNAITQGHFSFGQYFPNQYWHGHEMLLGYTAAVIAGFLLTAVKNWTGKPTTTAAQLFGLCLLWLYGRLLPFYAGLLPDALIALIDWLFLPTLTYLVAKPIIERQQFRNLQFIGLLLLLITGNTLIHLELLGLAAHTASTGILLIIATIIVLILVIAGRVFPFFTERGIPGSLIIRNPTWDAASLISAGIVFVLQLFGISGTFLALAAILAVIANTSRLINWYVSRIWYVPLLWVLYLGYGWIILGFLLLTFSSYSLIPSSLALHAFTVGGIGVLTLGMMARVALGHTGRVLKASNTIAIAFALINIAALIRVLLPIAFPGWYQVLIYISTLFWLAAFSLFLFVYGPIVTSPRIDGQEG